MSRLILKGPNEFDKLLTYIESNEIKEAEALIYHNPSLLDKKCQDGSDLIDFIIRNKSNKMFTILLQFRPSITYYNLPNMFHNIIERGTSKMLRTFVNHFQLNLEMPIYENYIEKILTKAPEMHSFLLLETNIPYSFTISKNTYNIMKYKCNYEQLSDGKIRIYFNCRDKNEKVYDLDKYPLYIKKEDILFNRFEKLFLVTRSSERPLKTLKVSTLTEIAQYI